jgi:hypothetical protein
VIPIHESYEGYEPHPAVRKCVTRLLEGLPPGHLAQLQSVVLTNAAAIGKGKTRRVRGRKYAKNSCLGVYHHADRHHGAWIEIVVDNVIGWLPHSMLRWNLFADDLFAKTVFHEVGHHLETAIGSPSKTGEKAADTWAELLRRNYLRERYWIQRSMIRPLVPLLRWSAKRIRARASKRESAEERA